MPIELRELRDDELQALGELLVAAYTQYFPTEPLSDEQRRPWEEYRENMADVASRIEKSDQIVAELDGRLVGGVTFYRPGKLDLDTDTEDLATPPDWAGIRLLGVHPDARGLGIGRLLTEECIRRARALGASSVALHTTELMKVARAMYERMGFEREPAYDFKPIPDSDFTVVAYRLLLT